MRRLITVLAATMLLAGCTIQEPAESTDAAAPSSTVEPLAQETTAASLDKVTTTVDGRERTYLRAVPAGYDESRSWPVVLAFHGWRETAEVMQRNTGLESARAIVVYAEGVDRAWAPAPYADTSGDEDIAFVRTILAELTDEYRVDRGRIFATGFSNGGGFAAYLGCQLPETFTAVAPVGAAYYRAIHEDCTDEPVARLDIHGTYDRTINYYGGTRHGTPYESVPVVLEGVADRNGCDGTSINRRSNSVIEQHWQGCDMPLIHVRVGGGEHVWPDEATAEVRAFFGV